MVSGSGSKWVLVNCGSWPKLGIPILPFDPNPPNPGRTPQLPLFIRTGEVELDAGNPASQPRSKPGFKGFSQETLREEKQLLGGRKEEEI